jgi:hypothetical protein
VYRDIGRQWAGLVNVPTALTLKELPELLPWDVFIGFSMILRTNCLLEDLRFSTAVSMKNPRRLHSP